VVVWLSISLSHIPSCVVLYNPVVMTERLSINSFPIPSSQHTSRSGVRLILLLTILITSISSLTIHHARAQMVIQSGCKTESSRLWEPRRHGNSCIPRRVRALPPARILITDHSDTTFEVSVQAAQTTDPARTHRLRWHRERGARHHELTLNRFSIQFW
jgi:hypothetical protein